MLTLQMILPNTETALHCTILQYSEHKIWAMSSIGDTPPKKCFRLVICITVLPNIRIICIIVLPNIRIIFRIIFSALYWKPLKCLHTLQWLPVELSVDHSRVLWYWDPYPGQLPTPDNSIPRTTALERLLLHLHCMHPTPSSSVGPLVTFPLSNTI